MAKKNKPDNKGYVYSTDPGFRFEEDQSERQTLPAASQVLRVRLETKHRAGKTVTLITGFEGTEGDLEKLGKKLKNACGTGGSAKDREIILQGDRRDRVLDWLQKNGYSKAKRG